MSEYLCDKCIHRIVCCNKGMYKAFQEAANDLTITIPGRDTSSNYRRSINEISWLQPTKLDCINYKY